LLQFESRVRGRDAMVRILTSRVEWSTDGRQRVIEMVPVTSISSIDLRSDDDSSRVIVNALGGPTEFLTDDAIARRAAAMLVELVAAAKDAQQLRPELGLQRPRGESSVDEELTTLRWLLDSGILTRAEFDAQRSRLLRR